MTTKTTTTPTLTTTTSITSTAAAGKHGNRSSFNSNQWRERLMVVVAGELHQWHRSYLDMALVVPTEWQ